VLLLADLILVIHLLFVLFIVGGLVATWLGAWRRWRWVRNFRFRTLHFIAILFVAAESVVGMACPLTLWEDWLRGSTLQTGFIQRWISRILYYDLPPWMFTTAYVVFALIVAATWFRVRPDSTRHKERPI
jgi:hypothetical protein